VALSHKVVASSCGRCPDLGSLEDELALARVDPHRVAFGEAALEELARERVLEEPLDRALERAGALGGIPAGLGNDLLGRVRNLE